MKIKILPATRSGKGSVVFFLASIFLAIAGGMISSTQNNMIEYPNPINSPLLGTTIYLRFLTAIIASITGLIAIKKENERSILVYVSIPIGVALLFGILVLVIGSIIGPPR